jgi:CBS domain-containing protein
MSTAVQPDQIRYAGPPFDQARVHDAMRIGVVTCRPDTSLQDVTRMMTGYKIHSVVVEKLEPDSHVWGIVSAIDVARAAASAGSPDLSRINAGDVATTDLVTVSADETLQHAALIMTEQGVGHLVVVQPEVGRPVGVLSATGLAAVLAMPR